MHIQLSITSSLSNKVIETFGIIDLISIFLWNTLQIAFFFLFYIKWQLSLSAEILTKYETRLKKKYRKIQKSLILR